MKFSLDFEDFDDFPSILTPNEVTELLCLHINTVYNLLHQGIAVAPEYMDFLRRYYDDWFARRLRMGTSWQQCLEGKRSTYADSLQKLAGIDFVICNDHGFPLSPDSYGELVRRVGEKAGIPHLHPHKFRHTFVSILLSNPEIGVANVAAVAGHAQPSTTLAIYTQVYQRRMDVIRRQMSEALYKQGQPEEPMPAD